MQQLFPDEDRRIIESCPPLLQAVFDMLDKAMMKIQSLDTSAWTDDEKTNF